jgi:hypothetical protein
MIFFSNFVFAECNKGREINGQIVRNDHIVYILKMQAESDINAGFVSLTSPSVDSLTERRSGVQTDPSRSYNNVSDFGWSDPNCSDYIIFRFKNSSSNWRRVHLDVMFGPLVDMPVSQGDPVELVYDALTTGILVLSSIGGFISGLLMRFD